MTLYSTYTSLTRDPAYTYKLVQLTNDVRERLEKGEQITIKSDPNVPSHLVLTASDSTWKIRQMKHTNTALVMSSRSDWSPMFGADRASDLNALVSIASLTYEYELTPTKGTITITDLPVYDPKTKDTRENVKSISLDKLLCDSCISEKEFYHQWYKLGGCDIKGNATILSPRYISELLQLIITLLIRHKILDIKSEGIVDKMPQIIDLIQQHASTIPVSAIETVVHKFSDVSTGQLDHSSVSEWFGIETLQKQASIRALSVRDFLMEWKSALPPFYNAPLDITQLQGYYYKPALDSVAYLDSSNLAVLDLSARVKELFSIAKEWEWEDFAPFIMSFVPSGKKPDAFMLKYCKRRRVGKKVLVSTR